MAIVKLWHPMQGVGGFGFAQLAAVLLPAGCWQEMTPWLLQGHH